MKKKVLFILSLIAVTLLTACSAGSGNQEKTKVEKETLSQTISYSTISVEVPKDKGYELTDEVSDAPYNLSHLDLELKGLENAKLYFCNDSYTYQRDDEFENHPELDSENLSIKDMVTVLKDSMGYELSSFNGMDAIAFDRKDGKKLIGYGFKVDQGSPYSYIEIFIFPSSEDVDVDTLLDDPELKSILDSVKLSYDE